MEQPQHAPPIEANVADPSTAPALPASGTTRIAATARARLAVVPTWMWVAEITFVALVLRRYHLGVESFWFDEADIVRQAQQPLGAMLDAFTRAGENGPLYTLLLHFWVALFGTGETAVRTLPLIFGTATVPVIYWLGKRVGGTALGLLAAVLLAVSPFHVWHSQDAKMYTLVVLVTLLSTALYLQALETGSTRWWAAYVLATWVALFTHGLAILILAAQLIATPLIWPRGAAASGVAPGSRRRRWLIALLVLLVPFLPIAWERLYAWLVGNLNGAWYTPTGLHDMLDALFVKFALNRALPPWETVGAWATGIVFAIGLWPWARTRRRTWAFLVVLWLAPILVFWLITLRVPLFQPRYLIIVLPFYLIFVAAGLVRLARVGLPVATAALLVLLTFQGAALAQINYSPQPQKEEWRQAIDYVKQHARLRDVIIVDPGYLSTAVQLYYQGGCDLPAIPIEAVPNLNTQDFGDRELASWLDTAITNHERVWLITSPERMGKDDPQGKVQGFFEGKLWPWPRYYQFAVQEYIGVKVTGYALNAQPHSWYPGPVYPQQVNFAGGFSFRGAIYEVRGCPGHPPDQVANAGWLPLTFYWGFDQPPAPDQDYVISIHVLDAQNREWATYDLPPLNGYRPTTTFGTDQVIDYPDIYLPGNTPPGTYHITFQVWPRCADGQCWDPGRPHVHSGQPLPVVAATAGAGPGDTTVTLEHPLTVVPWQPTP